MSDVTTGLAEIGEGALIARALEPAAGEVTGSLTSDGGAGLTTERTCLNCGTALIGEHCHACGQTAHVHRTLGAFFHDLAHGVFHVEGKIWRTVPMLVLHPGRLTREYIEGRRASYLSPIALFLFSVFLLVAVVHWMGGPRGGAPQAYVSIDAGLAAQTKVVDRLVRERAAGTITSKRAIELDAQIKTARAALGAMTRLKQNGITDEQPVRTNVVWLNHAIKKFQANPDLAIYKLQNSAYKYSWLLIPISVPLVWLLFPFSRRFRLYDHTVFVTYSLAFMTLLTSALSVIAVASDSVAGLIGSTVPPVHMYRQLRGAYGLGRAAAVWRTIALVILAATALGLFALSLLSMEAVG